MRPISTRKGPGVCPCVLGCIKTPDSNCTALTNARKPFAAVAEAHLYTEALHSLSVLLSLTGVTGKKALPATGHHAGDVALHAQHTGRQDA